jgi:hypothetical protein
MCARKKNSSFQPNIHKADCEWIILDLFSDPEILEMRKKIINLLAT